MPRLCHIFIGKALLVWQPHIGMHINVAFALIHRLKDRGVVAGHVFNLTANARGHDLAQHMANGLRAGP